MLIGKGQKHKVKKGKEQVRQKRVERINEMRKRKGK